MEAVLTFTAVVGLVGIKVNREDSFLMGWIMLIACVVIILLLPIRYYQAVGRYQEETSREENLEPH